MGVIKDITGQKFNHLTAIKWSVEKALGLISLALVLSGCSTHTCVPIEYPSCPPMLREKTYKAMQADERRDYRIAVERCQAMGDK